MKIWFGIVVLVTVVLTGSCTKKSIPSPYEPEGLDYYPLKPGKFIVYDVDSTVYTQLPSDTLVFKYRIKEKIADSFTDNTGKQAIRLERYIKKYNPAKSYDSIPWTIKEVWVINADNRSVQVVESNLRFTKLVFPVTDGTSWNGNAFNTLGEWEYMYDYVDKAETINGTRFEKVCMVKQKLLSTLISYQNYCEKYALNTGLVYREIQDLVSKNIVSGVPVQNRISSGVILKQYFVSQGYE